MNQDKWASNGVSSHGTSKLINAGRRLTSPRSTVRNQMTTSQSYKNQTPSSTSQNFKSQTLSSKNVSNRLFNASLSKRKPCDEYVEYHPVMTGAQRYGGQVDDSFDIRDLMFAPPPQVKQIPKRILPPGSRSRRKTKFNVPEEGDCDNRGQCQYCGRKFAMDRLPVHESICCRCSKPRRSFYSQKNKITYDPIQSIKSSSNTRRMDGEKPQYVIEHEKLIHALRAARRAEKAESFGQKKLIAPKCSSNGRRGIDDGRFQCPYCGRKFGKEQAERHIRFCDKNAPAPRGPMTTRKIVRGKNLRN